jgi:hypothetical protein
MSRTCNRRRTWRLCYRIRRFDRSHNWSVCRESCDLRRHEGGRWSFCWQNKGRERYGHGQRHRQIHGHGHRHGNAGALKMARPSSSILKHKVSQAHILPSAYFENRNRLRLTSRCMKVSSSCVAIDPARADTRARPVQRKKRSSRDMILKCGAVRLLFNMEAR